MYCEGNTLAAIRRKMGEGATVFYWMVRGHLSEEVAFKFQLEENGYVNKLVVGRRLISPG